MFFNEDSILILIDIVVVISSDEVPPEGRDGV
jgi:hypothetical protein